MNEEYSKDRLTRERDQWRDIAERALEQVSVLSVEKEELIKERDRCKEALQEIIKHKGKSSVYLARLTMEGLE